MTERQELVLRLHKEEGMTYRQIAEGLKLSPNRVWQIAAEARQRLEKYEANPRNGFTGLPERVRKAVEDYLEFRSRSEVLAAVQSGRLYYNEKEGRRWKVDIHSPINFARLRNAGWKSWEILLQWLNLETAAEQEQRAEEKRRMSLAAKRSRSQSEPGITEKRACPICEKEYLVRELPAHLAEHWQAHKVKE